MRSDTISVNGQTVEVPATPINPCTTFSSFLRPRVCVAGDLLTLEVDRGMRPLGLLFLVWGLGFGAFGVSAIAFHWPVAAVVTGLLPGVICPLVGLFLFLFATRHEFDRREGVYRHHSLVAPSRRPLAEIVAVQVIRGQVVELREDGFASQWQTYELNLVVAADGVQRAAVTCRIDDAWVAEAGRAVSEFLGVPYLCRLAAERGATADGVGTS